MLKDKTREQLEAVLDPLHVWALQCHAASIELVHSGVLGKNCRVARGTCTGVGGQHSWVVLGLDCYDSNAKIIDPTLWSYDDEVEGIWYGSYTDGKHRPHGKGSIWEWGRPNPATSEVLELTPRQPWSLAAESFLALLGPLDFDGWAQLAHAPVEGWPAGEIIDAMLEHERLAVQVPIDIQGMVTDRNPHGLYLPEGVKVPFAKPAEETADERKMIEEWAEKQMVGIREWRDGEDGIEASLGQWSVVIDDDSRGLYDGEEGEVHLCVVGAAEYHNVQVKAYFVPEGCDSGNEVRLFDDVEPL